MVQYRYRAYLSRPCRQGFPAPDLSWFLCGQSRCCRCPPPPSVGGGDSKPGSSYEGTGSFHFPAAPPAAPGLPAILGVCCHADGMGSPPPSLSCAMAVRRPAASTSAHPHAPCLPWGCRAGCVVYRLVTHLKLGEREHQGAVDSRGKLRRRGGWRGWSGEGSRSRRQVLTTDGSPAFREEPQVS